MSEKLKLREVKVSGLTHSLGKRLHWDANVQPPDIKAHILSKVQYFMWEAE